MKGVIGAGAGMPWHRVAFEESAAIGVWWTSEIVGMNKEVFCTAAADCLMLLCSFLKETGSCIALLLRQ